MRNDVLKKLRPKVASLLADTEAKTGIAIRFVPMPPGIGVLADYTFAPAEQAATIRLRRDWADVDVAHELTHMRLELVDGHPILTFRRTPGEAELAAVNLIRSYADDELVHAELVRLGFHLDGEFIKAAFFDDVCTNVSAYLRGVGRADRRNDGMAHLDYLGYGVTRRTAFYVQAKLLTQKYGDTLSRKRLSQVESFIAAFAEARKEETARAKEVLRLFEQNDLKTVPGHAAVLTGWAKLEGLDGWCCAAVYQKVNGRYNLESVGTNRPSN